MFPLRLIDLMDLLIFVPNSPNGETVKNVVCCFVATYVFAPKLKNVSMTFAYCNSHPNNFRTRVMW